MQGAAEKQPRQGPGLTQSWLKQCYGMFATAANCSRCCRVKYDYVRLLPVAANAWSADPADTP